MYKKKYGQNFLINNSIAKKIIELTDIYNENILEIGPGNLILSKLILDKKPKKYIAVEIDKDIFNKHKKFFSLSNAKILNEDALSINEVNLFKNENFKIISNLPFNISTQLLIKWLEIKCKSNNNPIKQMILMFQKELSKRITAKVNDKYYGRLSVLTSAFFNTKELIVVKNNEFYPVPKVDASVIIFDPIIKNKIEKKNFNKLKELTFLFFNSRRKKNKKKIINYFDKYQIKTLNLNKFYELRPENIDAELYYKMCSIKN